MESAPNPFPDAAARNPGGQAGVDQAVYDAGDGTGPEGAVTELSVLLLRRQAAALEEAARLRGLTVGQLVRGLICGLLAGQTDSDGFPDRTSRRSTFPN